MSEPCPVCEADVPASLNEPVSVPVLMHRLYATSAEGRAAARGTLALVGCRRCGFVWNRAFRSDIIAYDEGYENDQSHSPAFHAHIGERARAVVAAMPEGPIDYLEVGCGQGRFIAEVARIAGSRLRSAVGFDPAWRDGDAAPGPGIEIHRCYFDDAAALRLAHTPNLVAARHTIEHVADPVAFLAAIRRALGAGSVATLFLETPCVTWVLANAAMQDLFYEHCSLFTAQALRRAMAAAGFGAATVSHVLGGQYWGGAARAGRGPVADGGPAPPTPSSLATARRDFVRNWRSRLEQLAPDGKVAIWGAGAKGVTFALLVDPDMAVIDHAVDINPAKQGLFLAGTGLPVLAPQHSAARRPSSILVMNPNYADEVRGLLSRANQQALVIPLA